MPERRPDLQALRAGYASQEARLRGAILAQFPAVSLGPNAARDTGDVYTLGLGIGISLPIFNGNRGVVASERATRSALGEAYAARIAAAASEVAAVRARQAIIDRQQAQLAAHLPTLARLVEQGRQAYAGGNLDPLVLLNMEQTWTDRRLEAIDLEAATCANQLGLEVLLAVPRELPHASPATSPEASQP